MREKLDELSKNRKKKEKKGKKAAGTTAQMQVSPLQATSEPFLLPDSVQHMYAIRDDKKQTQKSADKRREERRGEREGEERQATKGKAMDGMAPGDVGRSL